MSKLNSVQERKSISRLIRIKPSTYEAMTKIAHMQCSNFNNLVNVLMEEYIENNQQTLHKYEDIFGDKLPIPVGRRDAE